MKTFLVAISIIILSCYSASAQVKWSAPLHQYPSQWSGTKQPDPIYESNHESRDRVVPNPKPSASHAFNKQDLPDYAEEKEEKRGFFLFRPRPGFSGNPFLHPPVIR